MPASWIKICANLLGFVFTVQVPFLLFIYVQCMHSPCQKKISVCATCCLGGIVYVCNGRETIGFVCAVFNFLLAITIYRSMMLGGF